MERTLQLFQLLIVVFGFYAALKYPDQYKNSVALSSIAVVIVLDRLESFFGKKRDDAADRDREKTVAGAGAAPAQKSMAFDLYSKNNLILIDAVQALLREIGLAVAPCPEYSEVDRVLKLEDSLPQFGVKIVGDLGELGREWEHLDPADGFIKGDGGPLRLLLIANNGAGASPQGRLEFEKIPSRTVKFLADRHTVAITTQTLARIHQLCSEMRQDPKRIFSRIYSHPGGVFQL